MPAEKQIEAVSEKLVELNPGFDGKITGFGDRSVLPKIVNGVVTEFGFDAAGVTDLSPVHLTGLPPVNIAPRNDAIGGSAPNAWFCPMSAAKRNTFSHTTGTFRRHHSARLPYPQRSSHTRSES